MNQIDLSYSEELHTSKVDSRRTALIKGASALWALRLLTPFQKQTCYDMSKEMLNFWNKMKMVFLVALVTIVEFWIYPCDPEP
ncbi:hypothetical protein TNCV_836801 [Trichonephila clavipes]|nr:hypothetical protein TNCV_836801 [Trichonephila clavipes]